MGKNKKYYNIVTYCMNCGKKIEKKDIIRKHYFCSKECSKQYRIKVLNENAHWRDIKLTYSGKEVYDPFVLYLQFAYRYYYRVLIKGKTEEEILSDAWNCYYDMIEDEGKNDIYAFYRAIKRFAEKEKRVKYYELHCEDIFWKKR